MAPVLARIRTIARRARELFPLTALGTSVSLGAAFALWAYGLKRIDLVLLVVGGVLLVACAVCMLTVVGASVFLWARYRTLRGAEAIRAECGYPTRTGFSLPSLWNVPFARASWSWESPEAEVRPVAMRRRLHEDVLPSRRGLIDRVIRRVDVGDAFGLARVTFRLYEERSVKLLPNVGALKQMQVVRSIASGDDMAHPSGPPEGERADMRRYGPGDPTRFILWKVFARNRQLVVRTPERALSPSRKTFAYLVTGPGDEPAAGAARVAVDTGALGDHWLLGADGNPDGAKTRHAALDLLARSAHVRDAEHGAGIGAFLSRNPGAGRVIVFVPAKPGPWIERVVASVRTRTSGQGLSPVEFVVCADGIVRSEKTSWLARMALRGSPGANAAAGARVEAAAPGATAADELAAVVNALGALRARVTVLDRKTGRVFGDGHRRALEAA